MKPTREACAVSSCLYEGHVQHRRFSPRKHGFKYRLFMVYLDLAELDGIFTGRWLWSSNRRSLARFRREDYLGDPRSPLDTCVRDLVEHETCHRPRGPVRLLTHLRYYGICFNPISIYYCFSETGEKLETIVAEVSNTPWGERHCYVLSDLRRGVGHLCCRFAKEFHVSPFMPQALTYVWRCQEPGERLVVHMDVLEAEQKLFDATLALRRRPMTGHALAGVLLRFPLMTLKVTAAIYWEALRLWLKRVPVFGHPEKTDEPAQS